MFNYKYKFLLLLLVVITFQISCSPPIPIMPAPYVDIIEDELKLEDDGAFQIGYLQAKSSTGEVVWSVKNNSPEGCIALRPHGLSLEVVAVVQGKATIEAVSSRGASDTAEITIGPALPRDVKLSLTSVDYLEVNNKLNNAFIKAAVSPSESFDKSTKWYDPKGVSSPVLTQQVSTNVDITAKAKGLTNLQVIAVANPNVKKIVPVTVNFPYDIEGDFVSAVTLHSSSFSGISFPTGIDDSTDVILDKKFKIAKNEVTYELWKKVYNWATDPARGNKRYYFRNVGGEGGSGIGGQDLPNPIGGEQQPVTQISWCDAVVWTNALTEWENYRNNVIPPAVGSFKTVYNYNSEPVRHFNHLPLCESIVADPVASGFRLPSDIEWEFAARLRADKTNSVDYKSLIISSSLIYYYTKGDSASGATDDITNSSVTNGLSWNIENSGHKTSDVSKLSRNFLKIHDMSGNVAEWVYSTDKNPHHRGGHWDSNRESLRIGYIPVPINGQNRFYTNARVGFRLAKNE